MMRKEIDLSQNQDESLIMQYLRARLSRESKPNIVEIYAYYRHKGKAYILMPLLEGDLKGLLTNDKHCDYFETDNRYMNEMMRVSRALASLHAIREHHQLYHVTGIHHDLKPDNILIDRGRCVLADLGLSTLMMPASGPETESTGHRTWYTAPEVLDNGGWRGTTSQKSDVFSLGCVFTELLVHMRGRKESVLAFRQRRRYRPGFASPVFATETDINKQVIIELKRIQQNHRDVVRSQVARVVLKMLAFDPDNRPSAKAVFAKFQYILGRNEPEPFLTGDEDIYPQYLSPSGPPTPYPQELASYTQTGGPKAYSQKPASYTQTGPPKAYPQEPASHTETGGPTYALAIPSSVASVPASKPSSAASVPSSNRYDLSQYPTSHHAWSMLREVKLMADR